MIENFSVKTERFEGPLDLLLSLVEKKKLFINDIALSKVTEDYIAYVKNRGNVSVGENAHFILIASILLLIKSKSLLPSLELTDEEEENIEELERRLKILKIMKSAARHIEEYFGARVLFMKSESKNISPIFSPNKGLKTSELAELMQNLINNLPTFSAAPETTVAKTVSIETVITNLTNRIQTNLRLHFNDFVKEHFSPHERIGVILSFLAMLELVRQGLIAVNQERSFSEISMETDKVTVPKYR